MQCEVVGGRDTFFTSQFREDLTAPPSTELAVSTTFNPATDGQTERTNRTLE